MKHILIIEDEPDIQELLAPMRKAFGAVKSFKPKSSRAESKETFFVGTAFRAEAALDPHAPPEFPPSFGD